MNATSTDVRAWFREQGRGDEVGTRGAVRRDLVEEYEQAHNPGTVPGDVLSSENDYPAAPDTGVTAADFPPDDEPADAGPAPAASHKIRGERAPRKVKGAAPKRLTERLFGGGGKPVSRGKHARVNLGDFAEETWTDLAWLAAPIPPLAAMLQIQAPYAGVVFDDAVKGTPVDMLCQPAARYAGSFRALNGLVGPPVYVGLICATGRKVQAVNPNTGQPATGPDGEPVMVFDTRTQMMFQGLRYSLLQMTKIADVRAEEIQERTASMAERTRAVDAMIESIFGQLDEQPATVPEQRDTRERTAANGYPYPEPPTMDGAGWNPLGEM